MKINFQSIKQAERLSSNEYVLTTIDNDVIHVALTTDEWASQFVYSDQWFMLA